METAAIEAVLGRIERMYASTEGGNPARLALAAGFDVDSVGRVTRRPTPPESDRSRKVAGGAAGGDPRLMQRQSRKAEDTGPGKSGGAATADEGKGDAGQVIKAKGDDEAKQRGDGKGRVEARGPLAHHTGTASAIESSHAGASGGAHLAPPASGFPRREFFFVEGDDSFETPEMAPVVIPLSLAQEWSFSARSDKLASGDVETARGADRRVVVEVTPPTVVFKSEWGRFRSWRRSRYVETDIGLEPPDPASYFDRANGTTGGLRPFDDQHSSLDGQEVNLIRRINELREKR